MRAAPKVAVVVPVYNKLPLTLRFLDSFRHVRYPHYELVIVDDGSTDGTAEALAGRPGLTVLRGDGNLWWTGATNVGVRYALERGFSYVLTINNDTCVCPDFLDRLVARAEAEPRTLVGSRINFLEEPTRVWAAGGRVEWSAGIVLQLLGYGMQERDVIALAPSPWSVPILTGCGTLVPAACYRDVGLYDDRWFPQYHADSEFVLRAARKGYRALVDLDAIVWNDARNTSPVKWGLRLGFSRRSPLYWRPLVEFHARYCPRRYLLRCLWRQYPRSSYWMRFVIIFLLLQHLARRSLSGLASRLRGGANLGTAGELLRRAPAG
jgi:GT2 family glycosyltransferase